METQYIHGYSATEQKRLLEQSRILAEYIFRNIDFTNHKHVLEVGMGVGAQTILLLERFPHLHITGVEPESVQLNQARKNLAAFPQFAGRYNLIQANAKKLDNLDTTGMDAVLFIWVLEHIQKPEEVLAEVRRVMPKGAVIYITEVLHSSLFLYPPCPSAMHYWRKFVDFHYSIGGDPHVGARLGVLLSDTGYQDIRVTPCLTLEDKRSPQKRLAILQHLKDLMHNALDSMIKAGYVTLPEWESAVVEIEALIQNPEAIHYYNSIQAVAHI